MDGVDRRDFKGVRTLDVEGHGMLMFLVCLFYGVGLLSCNREFMLFGTLSSRFSTWIVHAVCEFAVDFIRLHDFSIPTKFS